MSSRRRLPAWPGRLLRWAAALLGAYALLVLLLWWSQEWLLFVPQRLPPEHRFQVAANVHETWVPVTDGRLHALHLRQPQPRGIALLLHGNGGHLDAWWFDARPYAQAGLDVLMIDYRGYGKSPGRIRSQAQLEADVRAAWEHTLALMPEGRRVLAGRSLGSGLAARLAAGLPAEQQPDVTVLVSPYRSIEQLALEHHPWVPPALMRRILRYPLHVEPALPTLRGPVWLLHGDQDHLIGLHHARELHALAPQTRLVVVPGGGHGDLQRFEAYQNALRQALSP